MTAAGIQKRVVVTGLGVASPIGIGVDAFWPALLAGKIGTDQISFFDTSKCLTHKGGEIKEFEPEPYVKKLPPDTIPRSAQLAVAVSAMALDDSQLLKSGADPERVGVCFGVVLGNRPSLEKPARKLYDRLNDLPRQEVCAGSHDVTVVSRSPATEFELYGPNLVTPTACAAGNNAIAFASDMIRAGKADAMIAGGVDELSETMFVMFNSFRSLAPEVVQPFDKNRKGLMLSEGAAALVLESYDFARARGASIYGEVLGYGNFTDAYHMTAPHPEGLGAARAMADSLRRSGLSAQDVSYINAHGTGTPINDVVESRAIRTVFGKCADSVPVSSIKSMIGHTQGAASAIEAVACLLAIKHNIIPPNMNYDEPDPECNLNIVANRSLQQTVDIALSNAFGFGGNISCVIFSRC
jgi:3-oxoacyl-[acyl-carrier-protein] synthase II